jgi:beta-lactamase regulating signal transducer with metallopeptidase domain
VSIHVVLEAALRTLIMGAVIFAALRLLRIHQVRAQRTAWLLALLGALAMPALVNWQVGPRLLPEIPAFHWVQAAPHEAMSSVEQAALGSAPTRSVPVELAAVGGAKDLSAPRTPYPAIALSSVAGLYAAVAAILLLRLFLGLAFALRLRNLAERRPFRFYPYADIRVSAKVLSPVTIASSVLLPADYCGWDDSTLRVVLTHEHAHVRQGDFYVQFLAGVHCALFWFNPFSWWLRRQLSELGEALSDRAAVGQAQSRADYAEILLAFATGSRSTLAGVGMARASGLSARIERLLNERGFQRSFADKQRLPLVAAGIVSLAMLASTSMVKVQAAAPEALAADEVATPASPPPPPLTAPAPLAAPTPMKPATAPMPHIVRTAAVPPAPPVPPAPLAPSSAHTHISISSDGEATAGEDGILAISAGDSRISFDSGRLLAPVSGDYIYYQHNGKPFVIQDADTIAKARALLAPMQELSRKQRELGRQQAELGRRQHELGHQQQTAVKEVDSPEFKRDMAELQKALQEMNLEQLPEQINERALSQIQARLGQVQARVGRLQSELGAEQGRFGEAQGRLGEEQGRLGEEQGRLGEQQRQVIEDARSQLKPLMEQAVKDGKARAIN